MGISPFYTDYDPRKAFSLLDFIVFMGVLFIWRRARQRHTVLYMLDVTTKRHRDRNTNDVNVYNFTWKRTPTSQVSFNRYIPKQDVTTLYKENKTN